MKFNTFKAVQNLSNQNLSNMYKHKDKNQFLVVFNKKRLKCNCKCLTFLYYVYPKYLKKFHFHSFSPIFVATQSPD